MYFHCISHSFRTNSCCYVLIISGKGDVSAVGRQNQKEMMSVVSFRESEGIG
jgi:hypothetical protein